MCKFSESMKTFSLEMLFNLNCVLVGWLVLLGICLFCFALFFEEYNFHLAVWDQTESQSLLIE